MPCPKTVGELIEQAWPDAQEVHDIEIYLDTLLAERGDDWWLEPPCQQHWVGAESDIKRLARQNAAGASKPRRRRKPAANRCQMEISF